MSDAARPPRRKSNRGKKPESSGKIDSPPPASPDAGEQMTAYNGDLLSYQTLPVVALGGSAGSIQALREFFARTPAVTGSAYVVIMHLAPGHVSIMPELLQGQTAMKVQTAEDSTELQPDTVYLIPPGSFLMVSGSRLRLTELEPEYGKRVVVDLFFRSLADSHGPRATAVVLSGIDSDGAIGIKRIKERGGLTIVQDPQEAEFSSMPNSAIATGMVDWILPVAIMPARIHSYRERGTRVQLPPEEGPQPGKSAGPAPDHPETLLHEVLVFLRMRTGKDFSHYKRTVFLHRVSHRMQISGMEHLADYLNYLRTFPGEAGVLVQDLLVPATNFFRDRESFQVLESHIPELFRDKKPGDTVRVWCPACATGEEAYSMAILLLEHAGKLEAPPILQVFGCDLNKEAIQTARAGFYPETIATDINEERLHRFFRKEDNGYRALPELREMILFAAHDLLKDAPFSRMDLISCRNLFIYFNHDAQAKALEIFHFAFRPGGLLFLGPAETPEERSTLFQPLNSRHRLYQQRPAERYRAPLPTGLSENTIQRVFHEHERLKKFSATLPGRSFTACPPAVEGGMRAGGDGMDRLDLHFRLLARFGPPSLLVNADHDVVHLSENVHPFLQIPEGEPTRSLMALVHPMLRLHLRAGLLRAAETGEPVEIPQCPLDLPGGPGMVSIRLFPGGRTAPGHLLILFEAHTADPATRTATAGSGPPQETLGPEAVVHQLEREVVRLNADLRATVEQYECTNEELKASNEELQAANEELRSVGEELETSREELQSINEELTTLNEEFRNRAEELASANSDLLNLMNATRIPTVFLDRGLQVMRYTPSAAPLFNFISGDVGRPITHLRRRPHYPEMPSDAGQVLRTLEPVEREIQDGERWLLARVMPYRTVEDRIAGVVLSFVDITARRNAEMALRRSEEMFSALIENAPFGVYLVDSRFHLCTVNAGSRAMFQGIEPLIGRDFSEILRIVWAEPFASKALARFRHTLETGEAYISPPTTEARANVDETQSYDWQIHRVALPDGSHGVVCYFYDLSEQKRLESAVHTHAEELRAVANIVPELLWSSGPDGEMVWCNDRWTEYTGQPPGGAGGQGWVEAIHPDDLEKFTARYLEAVQEARKLQHVQRIRRADGEYRWHLMRAEPLTRKDGSLIKMYGAGTDIHDLRMATERLRESENRLRTLADAVPQIIWTNSAEGKADYFNQRWYEYSGCSFAESAGLGWQLIVHPDDTPHSVALWEKALLEGRIFDCEYRLRNQQGNYRWFIARNVPMKNSEGRVTGWFGTATDIHDLKNAASALLQSEEQFRRAIEDAPIPVIMHAEDGQVLQISRTWTELTGYMPEDIPTFDAWLSRTYSSGMDNVRSRMQGIFEGVVPVLHEELNVTTASGEIRRWALSASAPGTLGDGRRFVVAMALDITERIRAEKALRESQQRLRLILENAREYAIFSLDPDRTITSWNTGAQAILGYTTEEAIGQSADCIFTPEDREAGVPVKEAVTALVNGSAADERWHIRQDGSRFWGSGFMTSMHDPQGEPVGFVKIFRDRTKEREARETLEQNRLQLAEALKSAEHARAQAIAASRAKDQFLAVLSHELRTPLTPILMATQVLAAGENLPPKVRSTLAMIERSVLVEIQLVNDLLDVTSIANGRMEVVREPMDLHDAIQQAIEISSPDFEAKDQQFSVELEAGEYQIQGDFRRLQQVVWNLLKNASKFTPRGGEIEISSRNEPGRIVVDVRDNGIGFEPDARERIFTPFEQESRSITRRHGGLGLGLSIAKATVEAHGGTIRAWSAGPGTGAMFRIELPVG
ncbi:MAG: signal transduction histidine kinase with CheB and CheR [Verrucomicrobiales bacterium]|nr:signal transduction histidine kinase with CheB and CheR [Verrucomicrobiales bacterium]